MPFLFCSEDVSATDIVALRQFQHVMIKNVTNKKKKSAVSFHLILIVILTI